MRFSISKRGPRFDILLPQCGSRVPGIAAYPCPPRCEISLAPPSFRTGCMQTCDLGLYGLRGVKRWGRIFKSSSKNTRPRPRSAWSGLGRPTRGRSGPSSRCLPTTMASWQRISDKSWKSGKSRSLRRRDCRERRHQSIGGKRRSCGRTSPWQPFFNHLRAFLQPWELGLTMPE